MIDFKQHTWAITDTLREEWDANGRTGFPRCLVLERLDGDYRDMKKKLIEMANDPFYIQTYGRGNFHLYKYSSTAHECLYDSIANMEPTSHNIITDLAGCSDHCFD